MLNKIGLYVGGIWSKTHHFLMFFNANNVIRQRIWIVKQKHPNLFFLFWCNVLQNRMC